MKRTGIKVVTTTCSFKRIFIRMVIGWQVGESGIGSRDTVCRTDPYGSAHAYITIEMCSLHRAHRQTAVDIGTAAKIGCVGLSVIMGNTVCEIVTVRSSTYPDRLIGYSGDGLVRPHDTRCSIGLGR